MFSHACPTMSNFWAANQKFSYDSPQKAWYILRAQASLLRDRLYLQTVLQVKINSGTSKLETIKENGHD